MGSTPVISTAAAETEREPECLAVIESIRSEDFGIGLQLEGRQKEVAHKQRQREGRGLQRLSKELYSKDTHFVLELIQNADDNSYNESLLSTGPVSVPALKFIIGPSSVTVLNNEVGFSERNIHAICDVGRSTKGAHQSGYIGQKGIGFKSVFRITDTPEIHSSGYHIRFDAKCDAIGYILPHWIEEDDREHAAVGKGYRELARYLTYIHVYTFWLKLLRGAIWPIIKSKICRSAITYSLLPDPRGALELSPVLAALYAKKLDEKFLDSNVRPKIKSHDNFGNKYGNVLICTQMGYNHSTTAEGRPGGRESCEEVSRCPTLPSPLPAPSQEHHRGGCGMYVTGNATLAREGE